MGTKRQSRKKKKREKRKKKRRKARKKRGSRPGTPSQKSLDLGEASDWPLHECYLSHQWNHYGATVHAVISRKHATGLIAAAHFEVDLEEEGVVSAQGRADLNQDAFMAMLVQSSTEENPLVLSEPYLVVKLVTEAASFGSENGHPQGNAYTKAARLFGDVDPSRAPDEIPLGLEPTEEVPDEDEGLFASLKRRLFG